MKSFIKKTLLFVSPFFLLLLLSIIEDPYKVFYKETYFPNEGNVLELNASVIKTELYLENRKNKNYDSFIFGNSRSDAFTCKSWKTYLNEKSNPFHFEGMGETLFGVYKKIKFIQSQGDSIKNALIILDEEMLLGDLNNTIHPSYITHYKVSNESIFTFYYQFVKIFFKPDFLISYYDFKINKKHKSYMKNIIPEFKFRDQMDLDNGDFQYSLDKKIKKDSINYYNNIEGLKNRQFIKHQSHIISDKEKYMFSEIMKIFRNHKTQYKVIISPLFNQIPICSERKSILNRIYGPEHVFDFSGINKYTNNIGNYYEPSHYKPYVANDILKTIYTN